MKQRAFFFSGLFIFCLIFSQDSIAQKSSFHFVKDLDTSEFKNVRTKNGIGKRFMLADVDIWDRSDTIKKPEYLTGPALLCIEGEYKNGLRENIFSAYLIDSSDHAKRYKVWEQTFHKNKLNGEWRTYSLNGLLVSTANFKDDSLSGISKRYRGDGIRIIEEREYFNGSSKYVARTYDDSGRLHQEIPVENKKINGVMKVFFKNGIISGEANFKDGKMDGVRKYYHVNGKLWAEVEYKDGKPWNVVSNYKADGSSCDAGTLNKGNGTIISYKEDGTVKAILNYVNGKIDKGSADE